jgi:tetratricopeptide (TPR) repeat protein
MESNGRCFSESFFTCARLLFELHKLDVVGQDESPRADLIRDQMDYPWCKLSDIEDKTLRGLSADLYTVGTTRIPTPGGPEPAQTRLFKRAVADDDWPTALRLIRENEAALTSFDAAFLRGVCWLRLGVPEVAAEFFHDMERLGRLTEDHQVWVLSALVLGGSVSEALARAQVLAKSSDNAMVLMKASQVMAVAADEFEGTNAESLLRDSIATATRALELADLDEQEGAERETRHILRIGTLLSMAINYDYLGAREKAVEVCRKALAIEPENANALMLLGWLESDLASQHRGSRFQRNLNLKVVGQPLPLPHGLAA